MTLALPNEHNVEEGSQDSKADHIQNGLVDAGADMLEREQADELHRTLFQARIYTCLHHIDLKIKAKNTIRVIIRIHPVAQSSSDSTELFMRPNVTKEEGS